MQTKPEDALEPGICANCNGSGEGFYDGTSCTTCGGSGVDSPRTNPFDFEEEE